MKSGRAVGSDMQGYGWRAGSRHPRMRMSLSGTHGQPQVRASADHRFRWTRARAASSTDALRLGRAINDRGAFADDRRDRACLTRNYQINAITPTISKESNLPCIRQRMAASGSTMIPEAMVIISLHSMFYPQINGLYPHP